jgi:hypothetical protein
VWQAEESAKELRDFARNLSFVDHAPRRNLDSPTFNNYMRWASVVRCSALKSARETLHFHSSI